MIVLNESTKIKSTKVLKRILAAIIFHTVLIGAPTGIWFGLIYAFAGEAILLPGIARGVFAFGFLIIVAFSITLYSFVLIHGKKE